MPLDLLLVENCRGPEIPVCLHRGFFFSVSHDDDDASFQTEEEEIVSIYFLRRQGTVSGRRPVVVTAVAFARS